MISLFHKYRSELLLFALIAQIVASPLADSRPLIGAVLAVFALALLLIGVSYIVNNKTIRIGGFPWRDCGSSQGFSKPLEALIVSIRILLRWPAWGSRA